MDEVDEGGAHERKGEPSHHIFVTKRYNDRRLRDTST